MKNSEIKLVFLSAISLIALQSSVNGAKILGIFPTMAKSHYIVGSSLMKGLAEKGHEVTMMSPFPLKTPMKNWHDIQTAEVLEASKGIMNNILDMRNQGVVESLFKLFDLGSFLTNTSLHDKEVQKLLKSNEKFDLVIMEIFLNEAMLGFGYHFNAPVVGVSTFGASAWTCDFVGSPSPPSYVPSPFIGFTDHMTFLQRLGNLLFAIIERVLLDFIALPIQEKFYNEVFTNPNKPTLHDLRKNTSLVLLNTHFSLSYPRPYVPNMIEVGGMHVNRKQRPLPADIKQFIESAKDGVVYFSMGSNIKGKLLPKEKLDVLINTFKSLKQKVLWKWEDKTLPGKPDNVLINDWFPQDDILAHPNVKVFITHGGLLSTIEAIYHGVPIIGMPMFGDQFMNMARAVKAGFGLEIDYNTLNVDELLTKILEMINNPKYSEKVKEISNRYRDQPMTPLETAIYWVEYVIRHKGAPHLHSAGLDLSLIEYHNIDAFAVIIGVLVLIIVLIVCMIKILISCICPARKDQKKVSNKKKRQ